MNLNLLGQRKEYEMSAVMVQLLQVISSSDASVKPLAMMIKVGDAFIASATVFGVFSSERDMKKTLWDSREVQKVTLLTLFS